MDIEIAMRGSGGQLAILLSRHRLWSAATEGIFHLSNVFIPCSMRHFFFRRLTMMNDINKYLIRPYNKVINGNPTGIYPYGWSTTQLQSHLSLFCFFFCFMPIGRVISLFSGLPICLSLFSFLYHVHTQHTHRTRIYDRSGIRWVTHVPWETIAPQPCMIFTFSACQLILSSS